MLLETLLQKEQVFILTKIFVRNHVTFFQLNGESFCTAAGQVYHHTNPMFDGPIIHIRAREEHDVQAKKEVRRKNAQFDYESDLWEKHHDKLVPALILKAAEILTTQGVKQMNEFLYAHLTILPEDQAKLMAKKLEDDLG